MLFFLKIFGTKKGLGSLISKRATGLHLEQEGRERRQRIYRSITSSNWNRGRKNKELYQTLKEVHMMETLQQKQAGRQDNWPFLLLKDSTKDDYLANNKKFIKLVNEGYSGKVFELNSKGQSPHTLWIGCGDSRAGDGCLATAPGEIFTHRNIGNIVNSNDISCQGVLQFAVDVLKVRKIIVCGHTDCGAVSASLSSKKLGGVLDLWLNPIKQVIAANLELLEKIENPAAKSRKLSELNIIASVQAVRRNPSVSAALQKGDVEVWGMCYDVGTGLLDHIDVPKDHFEDVFSVKDA